MEIEALPGPKVRLGEGPHWDIDTQSLYFVDIFYSELPFHRYDYKENKIYSAKLIGADSNYTVSFIIPVEGEKNHFAIARGRSISVIEWDGKSDVAKLVRNVTTVDKEDNVLANRINDGKADPAGRVCFGSMASKDYEEKANGSAYCVSKDKGTVKLFGDIYIANGLTWNVKERKFYYIDSLKKNIVQYDYDQDTGKIGSGRELIKIPLDGLPDGMTIDAEGYLYVAVFGTSRVLKVCPKNGTVVQEIVLPVNLVTSVAFGGPNLDILYVTTAGEEFIKPLVGPGGFVYQCKGVGKGLPMNKARI